MDSMIINSARRDLVNNLTLGSEVTNQVTECIMGMLNNYNTGMSQDQFYKLNIVDATDVTETDMRRVNEGVVQYCRDNRCYAALPPFEEGVFIDRSERRYSHWKVLDVEDDYFRIQFDHYPIIFGDDDTSNKHANVDLNALSHKCWYLACSVIVRCKVLTREEYASILSVHPDIAPKIKSNAAMEELIKRADQIKSDCMVGGIIEDYTYYMSDAMAKIAKKGKYSTPDGKIINGSYIREAVANTMEYATEYGKNSMLYTSAAPILEMFQYINYMLSKQSTKSSTHRSISALYSVGDSTSDLRKERHFGRITLVSEKKPRTITKENIHRVYTTMSWQRRSHVRHLKSGKVVVVKSATCHRHEVESSEVPQVIYKV